MFNTKEFYYDAISYQSKLPNSIINEIEQSIKDSILEEAKVGTIINSIQNKSIRKNKVSFIPATSWIASFCHYYVNRANQENFQYNLSQFYSGDCLQYSVYEQGEYYNWHVDSVGPENGFTRKLSFSLQLSD